MVSRLPTPGGDTGNWGDILNDFLSQSLTTTGGLKDNSVGTSQVQDGAITDSKISGSAAISKTKLATDVQASLTAADAAVVENVSAVGSSGSTETLSDVTTATVHRIVLDANCALTFPTAAAGKSFTLLLVQDGVGSRTVTWPGSILWASGIVPVLTTTMNKQDLFSFVCIDGTNWLGLTVGQGF